MLAAEAIMRHMAEHFGEYVDAWGLAGLLHDVDYDKTKDTPEQHGLLGAEMLREAGCPRRLSKQCWPIATRPAQEPDGSGAVCHRSADRAHRGRRFGHPDKKLNSIDSDFVMNRFGERSFARSADRDTIRTCADFGMEVEEFVAHGLKAMQGIHQDLGL